MDKKRRRLFEKVCRTFIPWVEYPTSLVFVAIIGIVVVIALIQIFVNVSGW